MANGASDKYSPRNTKPDKHAGGSEFELKRVAQPTSLTSPVSVNMVKKIKSKAKLDGEVVDERIGFDTFTLSFSDNE